MSNNIFDTINNDILNMQKKNKPKPINNFIIIILIIIILLIILVTNKKGRQNL